MITWTEELHSMKPDTNSNNYNESQNRPPLSICNSFRSRELSVKFLESTARDKSALRETPARPAPRRIRVTLLSICPGVPSSWQFRQQHTKFLRSHLNTQHSGSPLHPRRKWRYNSLAIPASAWIARSTALRSHLNLTALRSQKNRRRLMAPHVASEQLTRS